MSLHRDGAMERATDLNFCGKENKPLAVPVKTGSTQKRPPRC